MTKGGLIKKNDKFGIEKGKEVYKEQSYNIEVLLKVQPSGLVYSSHSVLLLCRPIIILPRWVNCFTGWMRKP